MQRFTLDPATATALGGVISETELVSSDGIPVGYFVPPGTYQLMRKKFYEWLNSLVTDEELRQALANPKRHTMDEVWKLFEDK